MCLLCLEMTQEYWVRIWRTAVESKGTRPAFLEGDGEFRFGLECHCSMVWWIRQQSKESRLLQWKLHPHWNGKTPIYFSRDWGLPLLRAHLVICSGSSITLNTSEVPSRAGPPGPVLLPVLMAGSHQQLVCAPLTAAKFPDVQLTVFLCFVVFAVCEMPAGYTCIFISSMLERH